MTSSRLTTLVLASALLSATACSDQAATAPTGPGLSSVLFAGDSIAVGEALPLAAAFQASGVGFESIAAEGGGNVVGPFAEENWPKISERITAAQADVVVYQLTTYDWGTEQEQRAAYEKLLGLVTGAGSKLAFVSAPPIRADDFYRPHLAELQRTPAVAKAVAQTAPGQAFFLDATAVWGETYQQVKDGKADRSADGIHTCPQGAARFTAWLVDELAEQPGGFTPAEPSAWANAGWSADKHFQGC
ncbi:SGNH/GDSL hydrolase family protein [Lentzea guizhouensis]|uniref:SGNH/GDSL hydrolase family protein n=1 Tax=Lentzea guizhouensis TaxID=1586287 RepID=UPI000A5CE73F|nr:SGNH/GDSL hydrolase family protein [Lentzea guizhouensis]